MECIYITTKSSDPLTELRAIVSKNGAISEVTDSDFSLFPIYLW